MYTPFQSYRARSAFSLVEVLVAISIALLIIGVAVMSIGAVNEEARIRRAGSTLEATARTAMQRSVQLQRDHWVRFSADGFSVGENGEVFSMPGDGSIELRHWGEENWKRVGSGSQDRRGLWHFSRQGLCEPLQVRMTLGSAVLEVIFDPLTGAVAKESLIVEKG